MGEEEYEILMHENMEDEEKIYMLQLMGYDLEEIFEMALSAYDKK